MTEFPKEPGGDDAGRLVRLSWLQVPVVLVMAWVAGVPRPLLLPLISLILLTEAVVFLLKSARAGPRARNRLSHRDLAGFLALLGFGAALLSDPGDVLPLLRPAGRE